MDYVTAGFETCYPTRCMRERIARDVHASRRAATAHRGADAGSRASCARAAVWLSFKFFDASGDLQPRPRRDAAGGAMCATRLAGQPGRSASVTCSACSAGRRAHTGQARETQIGVECIGEAGPQADAEVVELMAELELAGAAAASWPGRWACCGAAGGQRGVSDRAGAGGVPRPNFVEVDRPR
ncbi:MAG: ATP phosphoribosyltransferase regulatory subunit [Eggerthella lenta]